MHPYEKTVCFPKTKVVSASRIPKHLTTFQDTQVSTVYQPKLTTVFIDN